MAFSELMLHEPDHARLVSVLERVRRDANAALVFLLDRTGREIATCGNLDGVDAAALASLAAGNVAATEGLAQLLGEREFSILFHEGEHDHLHINTVGGFGILIVRFDARSSVGLVRLRVQHASPEIAGILHEVAGKTAAARAEGGSSSPFFELTDEDIDALFR